MRRVTTAPLPPDLLPLVPPPPLLAASSMMKRTMEM
jgi:hypothetical protein